MVSRHWVRSVPQIVMVAIAPMIAPMITAMIFPTIMGRMTAPGAGVVIMAGGQAEADGDQA